MNYREKIRKAIACPQFGDVNYGEWGTLTLIQRRYIKELLDELDRADNYLKNLYLKNRKQKEIIDRIDKYIKPLITNRDDEQYYAINWYNKDVLLSMLKEVLE